MKLIHKNLLTKILSKFVEIKEDYATLKTDQYGQFNLNNVPGYILEVNIDYRYMVVHHSNKSFRVCSLGGSTVNNTQVTVHYIYALVGGVARRLLNSLTLERGWAI